MPDFRPLLRLLPMLTLLPALPAFAGPYGDALGKCTVAATTEADRASLVRWFFAAASMHPSVKGMAMVTPADVDRENKGFADLFTKLMTESCKTEAAAALKYEGSSSIEIGFQLLGQVAGRELFQHPAVAAGISGMEKHIDQSKFDALTAPKP